MEIRDLDQALMPLDEDSLLSLAELAELSGLNPPLIQELAQAGLIEITSQAAWTFTARSLGVARRARRLRTDFELDESATVLALTLLRRIEALEARLRELECQLLD